MKIYIQILIVIVLSSRLSLLESQCPTEHVKLTSQSQVDSFLIKYPNCESLEVNLNINNYWGDISDLQAFDNIKSIKGDLSIIANRQLIHLDAFNNLETVSGSVSIDSNTSLETIKGFSKLKSAYKFRVAINDKFRRTPFVSKS